MLAVPPRTVSAVQALLANTRVLGRQEAVVNRVTFEQIAGGHLPQLEVMQLASALEGDGGFTHRNVILLCSRRAAKSTSIMALLAHEGNTRNGVQLYFGKTAKAVRLSIWTKMWRPFVEKFYKGKYTHNDTSMVTTFASGGIVAFTGTDDRAHIETYLGNKFSRAIIDECFPAGTLVDGRPIESVRVGDVVSCLDHTTGTRTRRNVVRIFSKNTGKHLISLRLSCGKVVSCTPDHPVFVKGRGYVKAEGVHQGDVLLLREAVRSQGLEEAVQTSVLRDSVHAEVDGGSTVQGDAQGRQVRNEDGNEGLHVLREGVRNPGDSEREGASTILQQAVCSQVDEGSKIRWDADDRIRVGFGAGIHDEAQSNGKSCNQGEGIKDAAQNAVQTSGARRERSGANGSGGRPGEGVTGLAGELYDPDGHGRLASEVRVSELIQGRPGGPWVDDMYRGRWSEPQGSGKEGAGQEEGGFLAWDRVESVSRIEPGSPDGTTVYNLEVEGAHTYFANGILVHNCQSQPPSVIDPLVDSIIPPALSDTGGQFILAGTIPEVPAGKFYEIWNTGQGWLKRNWNRFANPHLGTVEHQTKRLEEYLLTSKRLITDALVRRDWFGEFVFDTDATAYPYQVARNGYTPQEPEWLEEFIRRFQGDPIFEHIHRTIRPNDGTARHGIMAAEPMEGVEVFAAAIDPGAKDRFTLVVVGWGSGTPNVQHVFEFSSKRKAKLRWSQLDPIRRLVQEKYNPSWWFYDAGGSTVVLDTFIGDTGLPALMPAAKAGLHGQVERVGDLMVLGHDKTMIGSACEEDYQKAQWNADARAKMQWSWDSKWHPDPAESKRYATAAYFEAFEPAEAEKSKEEKDRERHELAVRRRNAQRAGMVLDEDMDAAIAADEEDVRWD